MSTVAIIGDVGGHADQLERCLAALGVTAGVWPDGLVVVQLGDLLGGVDDVAVVDLVEAHIGSGRWVQLAGNWDSRLIGGVDFTSRRRGEPDPVAERRFADWHAAGHVALAATVTTKAGSTAVITHAGIAEPFWRRALRSEPDPVEAAGCVNLWPTEITHQPGAMLAGRFADEDLDPEGCPVGPVWADTGELWGGWLNQPSPFPQVHGHTSAWFRDDWGDYTPRTCTPYAERDRARRHTRYRTHRGSGPTLIGIDCSVYAARDLVLHPLVIPNATVDVPRE